MKAHGLHLIPRSNGSLEGKQPGAEEKTIRFRRESLLRDFCLPASWDGQVASCGNWPA